MTFDDNENLLTQTDPSGTLTYAWDARNRVTALNGPGLSASFAYDGLGRRAQTTVNSLVTQFRYDGLDTVHYVGDALGSSVALTTPGGTVTTTYTYEPFGRTETTETPSANAFRFTGREDDGTGLYYYRARYYDPGRGRFVSEDPIGLDGGFNSYQYAADNPNNYVDPLGLVEWSLDAPSPGILDDLMKDAPESQRTCSDRDDQCRKEFFECLGLEILAPGWSSVAMGAGEAAGPYFGAKAYQHAAARNLNVPMRSSIVRRHLSISRRISPITALASIILAEGICLAREIKCLEGR